MGMYLVGVHLTERASVGVYLVGVHPTGCAPHRHVPYWACTSLRVHLMGVVCLEAFRFFNLGEKSPYTPP
jgi:hypothetical protein